MHIAAQPQHYHNYYHKHGPPPKRNVVSSSLAGGAKNNAESPVFEGFLLFISVSLMPLSSNRQRSASRSTRIGRRIIRRRKLQGFVKESFSVKQVDANEQDPVKHAYIQKRRDHSRFLPFRFFCPEYARRRCTFLSVFVAIRRPLRYTN